MSRQPQWWKSLRHSVSVNRSSSWAHVFHNASTVCSAALLSSQFELGKRLFDGVVNRTVLPQRQQRRPCRFNRFAHPRFLVAGKGVGAAESGAWSGRFFFTENPATFDDGQIASVAAPFPQQLTGRDNTGETETTIFF
jgi:hypothetical protein